MSRKCEIQTSRANSHPKFTLTVTLEQRGSGKLSNTVTALAALQDRTQNRPTTDSAFAWLHSSLQVKRCAVSVPSSHGWSVSWKVAGVCRICACSPSSGGKGSGNPAPKLADRWKSAVWLGKSDFTDEHLVRTDEGVVYSRSIRRLAEHSWSPVQLWEHHRCPSRRQWTSLLQSNLSLFLFAAPEVPEDKEEEPTVKNRGTRRNAGGGDGHTNGTRSFELKQR